MDIADKPSSRPQLKGYLALLGGVLMTMVWSRQCSSILNAWGTLSIYIASYYYEKDNSVTLNMFMFLYPVWCLGNCPGISSLLAGVVFTSGFFLGAFIENTYLFLVVLGLLLGIGEGLTLMTPIWSAWKYFPDHKGAVTGAVLFGYGFGPSMFGIIFTFLANPNDYPATIKIDHGEASYFLFDSRVADRIPATMLYFSGILGSIYLLSVLLISEPTVKKPIITESLTVLEHLSQGFPECPDLRTGFKTVAFWQLLVMQFLGQTYAIYIMNVFKAFGQEFIDDDYFLSVVGSAGTFAFAVGCFVLPAGLDYVSFKVIFCSSLLTQALLSATFDTIASNRTLFALWLCFSYFASGGYFAMFAVECTKVFGPKYVLGRTGSTLFSFIEQGFSIAAFIDFFIFSLVGGVSCRQISGYQMAFFVLTGLMLANVVLTILLRESWTSQATSDLSIPIHPNNPS